MGINNIEELIFTDSKQPFGSVFLVRSLLGVGAFGVVLEVTNRITREISALKVRFKVYKFKVISKRDQKVFEILIKEHDILRELSHPNIISFKQVRVFCRCQCRFFTLLTMPSLRWRR